jgi:gamma-glutamyltranspeptidase/glutathione hydrolase
VTVGVVAAGHTVTAGAAAQALRAGGNAFDAVLAGLAAACVAEPVLASLGGGGFLLARPAQGAPRIYDFFVQTPARTRPPDEIEFEPILADFGTAVQEFHIGRGTIAVPGVVRGLFAVHEDLARMPMRDIVAPAVEEARRGVVVTAFQAYLFEVIKATMGATEACRAIFASRVEEDSLVTLGESLRQPELADTFEILAIEGADLFYRGEMGREIVADLRDGGLLDAADLERYVVERRAPLAFEHHGVQVLTNPPPSSGGLLVGFGARMLDAMPAAAFGSSAHVLRMATAMELTAEARVDAHAVGSGALDERTMLDPTFLARYRAEVSGRLSARRGTTHLSVVDAAGNLASLTVSNGEGSGYVVPGTGVVLNNMLGEEDLNPGGFHRWPAGQRMTSMMAPTALGWSDGRLVATGSGGSNRIRTALLQLITNLVEHAMDVEEAVRAPRIHFERGLLSIEGGFDETCRAAVADAFPELQPWDGQNMFFGGTHTVMMDGRSLRGAGDERRGGVCLGV